MKFVSWVFVASVGCLNAYVGEANAENAVAPDVSALIMRMSDAATNLCYMGTFVRESGGQMESLRIAHYTEGKEESEKVEFLDGPAREVVRNNEQVEVYLPGSKIIKQVHRKARKFFPALLTSSPETYAENYRVTLGKMERVAGHECQGMLFEPKDGMRYPRWFCAEQSSGLIIKTSLKDEKGVLLEQMSFTQLTVGKPHVKRDHTKSSYPDAKLQWRTDASPLEDLKPADSGWVVSVAPAGFRKAMEVQRNMPNKDKPIYHQVMTDGLAQVSIFIEPKSVQNKPILGASHQGSVNTFISTIADHLVTVMGEVPSTTVQQIAQAVKPPVNSASK
jgi:sigma-E factor negative regulatory protein RseB